MIHRDALIRPCAICGDPLGGDHLTLDFRTPGIGLVHREKCESAARERAYARLAKSWGLEAIRCQCLHGVGRRWNEHEFLWHDRWDHCRIRGRYPYRSFDHMRMWTVREESSWAGISPPETTILTTEPYTSDHQPIADDSWLWSELGFRLREYPYPDLQLHCPTVDGSTQTVLIVWSAPLNAVNR